jgi:hypothetical protein
MRKGPAVSKRERKPRLQSKSVTLPVASASSVSVSVRVIRAAHTKWGSREKWGKLQFVQVELCAIFPGELPPSIKGHDKALVKAINDRLERNSDYQAKYRNGKVNNKTVARALEKLRAG